MTKALSRIALAESKRHLGFLDKKVLLGALAVGLILGLAWPAVQDDGVRPDAGIYVVGVRGQSPLEPVLASDPTFLILDADAPGVQERQLDLLVQGEQITCDPGRGVQDPSRCSEKAKAALSQVEGATQRWLDQALADEDDQAAAFPVRINAVYQTRNVVTGQTPSEPNQPGPDGSAESNASSGGQTNASQANGTEPEANLSASEDPGLLEQQGTQQVGLTPDELDPPFPLESLLLTFAYLIPLTFISELYSGSIFSEKTRSRGIMLLAGPVTSAQVLIGKSLPYIGVMAVIAIGVTIVIGSNVVGLAAVVPIVAFVLSSSLLLSILSPSQRALTFLLVSTNVGLSTFLFLPALFTQIEPIAFLSPVAVIGATIRGDPVSLGPFLYATVPMALAACTLTGLAAALYRAETLFTPGGTLTKLVDGVSRLVGSKRSLLFAGMLAVPFAFAAELFVLIFAVTLDLETAFFVFLIGSALVEEVLKGLPSYAGYTRSRTPPWPAWLAGGLIGLGFFLGEKGALAFTVFGFGLLPRGDAALATFGVAASPFLVVAPLILHMVTAGITAMGARRSKRQAGLALISAILIHAVYNLLIVRLNLGGGLP